MNTDNTRSLETDFSDYDDLPPDLTPDEGPTCCGTVWEGWVCTRIPRHTGRHAAGDTRRIVAVWED